MSEHIDHSAKVSIDHGDDNDEAYELMRDLRNEQVVRAKSTAKKVQLERSLENKIKEIINMWEDDIDGWEYLVSITQGEEAAKYEGFLRRSVWLRDSEIEKLRDPSIEIEYPMD